MKFPSSLVSFGIEMGSTVSLIAEPCGNLTEWDLFADVFEFQLTYELRKYFENGIKQLSNYDVTICVTNCV
jgi:hypothetical protein